MSTLLPPATETALRISRSLFSLPALQAALVPPAIAETARDTVRPSKGK